MSSVWEPISLRDAMNRLMEESFVKPRPGGGESQRSRVADLPIDVQSTDDALILLASIPGISPDDVEINIEGDTLTIQGEFRQAAEEGNWIMQERYRGPFQRVLTLNVPVQADKAEAVFKDGVLKLTLPKAEQVKPKVIKVKSE